MSEISTMRKNLKLEAEATHKKFLLVRQEDPRQINRNIDHYDLDMIIALGYRVQSDVAFCRNDQLQG